MTGKQGLIAVAVLTVGSLAVTSAQADSWRRAERRAFRHGGIVVTAGYGGYGMGYGADCGCQVQPVVYNNCGCETGGYGAVQYGTPGHVYEGQSDPNSNWQGQIQQPAAAIPAQAQQNWVWRGNRWERNPQWQAQPLNVAPNAGPAQPYSAARPNFEEMAPANQPPLVEGAIDLNQRPRTDYFPPRADRLDPNARIEGGASNRQIQNNNAVDRMNNAVNAAQQAEQRAIEQLGDQPTPAANP